MNLKYIVLGLCGSALLSMSACNDFLDERPRSEIGFEDYYKTQGQAQENVNALYRRGAPNYYGNAGAYQGAFASIPVMLTGYFTNSYEGQEQINQYSRQLTRQQNTRVISGRINDIWNPAYESINIANAAIKYIPTIAMADDVKARLIGEARFFRAFNYFFLVKMFGALPMPTEPYVNLLDQDFFLARTPVEEVYALIESDLTAAVEALPSGLFNTAGRRVNRNVAAMALANAYLQQGKFAQAASAVNTVLESGHSLATNTDLGANSAYNKLRTSDNLDETIYAMVYDNVISPGGHWPATGFSSSATSVFDKYQIFERNYGPTNRFLNVYEADDLRYQPNQFYHWTYTNPLNGRTWNGDGVAGVWYFVEEDALLNTGRSIKDRNIYRYAEALLIAAEANARANGVASAAGYLAQVRSRASTTGQTVAAITSQLQGLSVDQFVQEVWKERLRELPLEFKMWDDCLRTGLFPNISESVRGQVTFQPLVGASNASGAVFKQSDLVYPISMDELQRNPNLEQNTDYQRN